MRDKFLLNAYVFAFFQNIQMRLYFLGDLQKAFLIKYAQRLLLNWCLLLKAITDRLPYRKVNITCRKKRKKEIIVIEQVYASWRKTLI